MTSVLPPKGTAVAHGPESTTMRQVSDIIICNFFLFELTMSLDGHFNRNILVAGTGAVTHS